MTIFYIGDAERQIITKLREAAASDPVPLSVLQELATRKSTTFFKDKTIQLHDYVITYTIELQERGSMRHISISIKKKGRMPLPEAVDILLQEFQFINPFNRCVIWLEEFEPGHKAVNILEPLDGNWQPFMS